MHLKNVATLKTAEEGADHFSSVRFAPVYDAVTTRVFPGLENDHMALKLNGRDDRLKPDDFLAIARTIELPITSAAEAMAREPASNAQIGVIERALDAGKLEKPVGWPTIDKLAASQLIEKALGARKGNSRRSRTRRRR